jgi:hypothetical protein
MARIESKLAALGLVLPAPMQAPPGVVLPFTMARIVGRRAIVSGHGPLAADGSLAQPLGKVGSDLTSSRATPRRSSPARDPRQPAARPRRPRPHHRVDARLRHGELGAGFVRQPAVINGFSELILELFGPEVGAHPRSAVGLFELPFSIPVEIEAEVEFAA